MNPLELRKQLLIAGSELNRAQLLGNVTVLMTDVCKLADLAKSFGSIASAATVLVTGWAAFQSIKPAPTAAKPSCLQTILKNVELISTV